MRLAHVLLDDRLESEALGERRRGLLRALERAHVDRGDRLVEEPLRDALGLLAPGRTQIRVAPLAEKRVRLAGHCVGRRAVADDEDLRGVRRQLEAVLGDLGVGRRAAHAVTRSRTPRVSRLAIDIR